MSYLAETLSALRTLPEGLEAICTQLADLGVAPRYPGWDAALLGIDVGEILESARRASALLEPLATPVCDTESASE